MTYFGFLALFLGFPIVILSIITIWDYRRTHWLPKTLASYPAWAVMLGLCIVAFLYTTPWDNYLVATGVWWYDINLVSGIVFGYVPIEEYTFFIVQPIMTSLLLLALLRYLPIRAGLADNLTMRRIATTVSVVIWLIASVVLALTFFNADFKPATYLALELSWALIPIIVQIAFGADILWRHRWQILIAIALSTVYLSAADALAINSGTWTIDPQQSLNIYIGGILPIEEFIFFLITNTLVVFGMTLVLAEESRSRAQALARFAILRPALRLINATEDTVS